MNTTKRYAITIPSTGSSSQVLFLRQDGSALSRPPSGTPADAAENPLYRANIEFSNTTAGTETRVRIFVTWPAMSDRIPAVKPQYYVGSFDITTALDRK